MPDLTGQEAVDRLPVIVSSSDGDSKLLGVPKIKSGTGQAQARAVFEVLKQWDIEGKVQGMCFDTTSSNTGCRAGTCVLLEQLLGRDLLHFACRHHVHELVAGAAFNEIIGVSASPAILVFKRFKAQWNSLDHSLFEDSSSDPLAACAVQARGRC